MNNKKFDNYIKNILDQYRTSLSPDWDKMSSKIEEAGLFDPEISDKAFDQLIAGKLSNIPSSFKEESWENLDKKMEQRISVGRQIILYQLSGAAVVLLLFFLWFQLYPPKQSRIINTVGVENNEKTDFTGMEKDQNKVLFDQKSNLPTDPNVNMEAAALPLALDDSSKTINMPIESTAQVSGEKIEVGNTIIEGAMKYSSQTLLADIVIQVQSKPEDSQILKNSNSQIPQYILHQLRRISPQIIKQFDERQLIVFHNQNTVKKVQNNTSSHDGLKLALHTAPKFTYVRSSFDQLMLEPGYKRNDFSLAFGGGVSYRKSNFELGLGIEYFDISYQPRIVEEYVPGESSVIYLNSIGCDMLRFPLQLKYHFQTGKINWYALGGVSLNVILSTDYEIHRKEQGLLTLINDLKTNPGYKSTLLYQKEFDEGLVQGEKVKNTVSGGIDFGIGFEARLTDDLLCFVEPQMQFDLSKNGIGPNHDKFYSLSINTGLKVLLY